MPDDIRPALPATMSLADFAAAPALAIWFDEALFDKTKQIATFLARADGITPKHLLGKLEACFFVVEAAMNWRLNPRAVACATYQTPNGQVGFEGKLCQAILENSGKIDGSVRYEHYVDVTLSKEGERPKTVHSNSPELDRLIKDGWKETARADWSQVQNKFDIAKSQKGHDYARRLWKPEDAKGLGVTVRARLKGRTDDDTWDFDLVQAYPLNSTLWATDPRTQICYTAVRRFANLRMPSVFMGLPFDHEYTPGDDARDVTPAGPRPTASSAGVDFDEERRRQPVDIDPATGRPIDAPSVESDDEDAESGPTAYSLINDVGEVVNEYDDPADFIDRLAAMAKRTDKPELLRENNLAELQRTEQAGIDCSPVWEALNDAVTGAGASPPSPPAASPPPPPASAPAEEAAAPKEQLQLRPREEAKSPPPPAAAPKIKIVLVERRDDTGRSDWDKYSRDVTAVANGLPRAAVHDLIMHREYKTRFATMQKEAPETYASLMQFLNDRANGKDVP